MIDEKTAIWALTGIKGLGKVGIRKLLEKFGSASNVFTSFSGGSYGDLEISEKLTRQLASPIDWNETSDKMLETIPYGAEMVCISDSEYPEKLRNIPDPPFYFYYKGSLECLEAPCLGIVGSRKPTDYGQRMTTKLTEELALLGITIVSGLAFGIDGFAHEAALRVGGKTAAVFGCSLDYIYPPSHRRLAEEIISSGCLISEFPKGTKPVPYNFPVRNRIISGLCEGVLVVEAAERSGALVTAGFALEQGRDVLAVPGSADSELSSGANNLLKQGAIPITGVQDILDNFGWQGSAGRKAEVVDLSALSDDETLLYRNLSIQPIHLDEVSNKLQMGPGRIAELLLNLELKGFILRKPGNFVVRNR